MYMCMYIHAMQIYMYIIMLCYSMWSMLPRPAKRCKGRKAQKHYRIWLYLHAHTHTGTRMYTRGVQTHSTAWTCVPPSTTYIHIHTITCMSPLTLAGLASQECLSAAHTCCGWACCPLGGRCRGLCTVLCC